MILPKKKILQKKNNTKLKSSRLQLPTTWLAIRETGSLEAIQGLGGWVEKNTPVSPVMGVMPLFLAYYVIKKLYLYTYIYIIYNVYLYSV